MQIILVNNTSPFLNEVIRLADENSSTLGFLPKDAFFKHAADQRIFVAIDEQDNVLGYLLYGVNQRESLAYITHLCVDRVHRGNGIAKALFERLVEVTKHKFWAIRVRCRREYEATDVWPKLGFHVRGEVPGRSRHGSTLTVWWFDFGHPTLFSYAVEQQAESKKLSVVIDANIFYDLAEPPSTDNELSHSLLADWLDIQMCLTNEIPTEINRNEDPAKRQRSWEFVHNSKFKMVTSPNDATQDSLEKLRNLFPIEMSASDESDLRQIAKTIAANVSFFVTNDRELLKKSRHVYEIFGMNIIHPTDLIIHQDALIREAEYQPARLAGSHIQRKRVSLEQSNLLENLFQQPQSEKKSEFRQKIHPFLADPHTFEVDIIQNKEQPIAFIVYSRQNPEILEIPFLRVVDDPLASTLGIHLIHNAVTICAQEGRILTKFTEKHLSNAVLNALRENEFVLNNEVWVKVNLPVVEKAEALRARLNTLHQRFPTVSDYFQQLAKALQPRTQEDNTQTFLQVEKSLWPAKIADLDIPAYIISIHPQWAMDLFDPNIANQTLFGADPFLILNVENVYYRSSRTKLSAPARILWYVTQGKGKFQGTMAIRACSYLDEVIVDKPKVLFSRFKRLGVYSWDDVFKVAREDIEQEIMVFRFSKTEVFNSPIHRNDLQTLWNQTKGRNFNVQSPLKIANEIFMRIYQSGIKI